MRIVILIATAIALVGCTRYEKITSGAIGCAPKNISIYDIDRSYEGTSWTAVCHNKIYYCFQADESRGGDYKCTPAK